MFLCHAAAIISLSVAQGMDFVVVLGKVQGSLTTLRDTKHPATNQPKSDEMARGTD